LSLKATATTPGSLLTFSEREINIAWSQGSAEAAPPQALLFVVVGDRNDHPICFQINRNWAVLNHRAGSFSIFDYSSGLV
jgi:hypothetical protein